MSCPLLLTNLHVQAIMLIPLQPLAFALLSDYDPSIHLYWLSSYPQLINLLLLIIQNPPCVIPSSATMQAKQRKHHSNNAKCGKLGWVCIPLVVESFGSWEPEAQYSLSRLTGRLATRLGQPKSITTNQIYGRLNLILIRANSRAILSRVCV